MQIQCIFPLKANCPSTINGPSLPSLLKPSLEIHTKFPMKPSDLLSISLPRFTDPLGYSRAHATPLPSGPPYGVFREWRAQASSAPFLRFLADFCHFVFQMNYSSGLTSKNRAISNWKHTERNHFTLGKTDICTTSTDPTGEHGAPLRYWGIYVPQ